MQISRLREPLPLINLRVSLNPYQDFFHQLATNPDYGVSLQFVCHLIYLTLKHPCATIYLSVSLPETF